MVKGRPEGQRDLGGESQRGTSQGHEVNALQTRTGSGRNQDPVSTLRQRLNAVPQPAATAATVRLYAVFYFVFFFFFPNLEVMSSVLSDQPEHT